MTAFNYRFVPAVRLARQMIEAGELGEIHHFRGRYLQDWGADDRRAPGGSSARRRGRARSATSGAHVIDLARYLVGEISAVSASTRTFMPGREVDDAFEARRGVRGRRDRHDRGQPLRAGPQERVQLGDQRLARARSPSTSSG